jgi:hypothetical protein
MKIDLLDYQPHELKGRRFRLSDLTVRKGRIEIWEEPRPDRTYVLGEDNALGMVGRDYDAIVILAKGGPVFGGKPYQVAEAHGHWGEQADRITYALKHFYTGAESSAFAVLERHRLR